MPLMARRWTSTRFPAIAERWASMRRPPSCNRPLPKAWSKYPRAIFPSLLRRAMKPLLHVGCFYPTDARQEKKLHARQPEREKICCAPRLNWKISSSLQPRCPMSAVQLENLQFIPEVSPKSRGIWRMSWRNSSSYAKFRANPPDELEELQFIPLVWLR